MGRFLRGIFPSDVGCLRPSESSGWRGTRWDGCGGRRGYDAPAWGKARLEARREARRRLRGPRLRRNRERATSRTAMAPSAAGRASSASCSDEDGRASSAVNSGTDASSLNAGASSPGATSDPPTRLLWLRSNGHRQGRRAHIATGGHTE